MKLWKMTAAATLFAAVLGAFFVFRPWSTPPVPVVNFDKRIPTGQIKQTGAQKQARQFIKFGFDLRASPEEDARQYLPFLKYLERATGFQFKLVFTKENERLADALGRGQVDIAAVGAVSFIRAQESYGAIPLVRGLNAENKAEYRSAIVVAPDSPITSLPQLRGKSFAFGSVDSTQGHIIPRIVLRDNELALDDMARHEYTGSHQSCANVVVSGSFHACGMQDTMALALARQGKLRILHISDYFPSSGIAARKTLDPAVREKIVRALIEFEPTGRHQDGLYYWARTEMPNGFVAAKPGDYAKLRDWVVKLGLLN